MVVEGSRAWLTCLMPANEKDDHAAGEISAMSCISRLEKAGTLHRVTFALQTRASLTTT